MREGDSIASAMEKRKRDTAFTEVGIAISELGVKKANTKAWQLLLLGFLAGLYISFGGHLSLVALQQGMGKVIAGAVFGIGLVLVIVAGAELFTGNVVMIVGAMATLYSVPKMLKNWVIVYIANFIGAITFTFLIYEAGLMGAFPSVNDLGALSADIAARKLSLTFMEAFIRGILCNVLVLLAIIMSFFAKDIISKIFACILPIMTFVASGFEHSIANMYLIPIGLLCKGAGAPELLVMFKNILPVTLGNIVGGVLILVLHPNRIHQLVKLINRKREMQANPKT